MQKQQLLVLLITVLVVAGAGIWVWRSSSSGSKKKSNLYTVPADAQPQRPPVLQVYPNRTANYSTTAVIALDAACTKASGGAGSTTSGPAGYLDLPTYPIDFGGSDVPTGFMMDKYCTAHMYKPYETMGKDFVALNGTSSGGTSLLTGMGTYVN